ncbi:MAG: hypothetical protein U0L42_10680 [Methanobrevibacter sp.]|uniref:hypothetical protein n=1 Tax=Methanobrevibacter sp. TaxID=66852 RepID=UPI002E790A9A|nr:hypothetical protein [Methanobrevibacter sp.]MEE0936120.1 hypothetical protein [Methanobrevibacter sp.]
MSKSKFKVTEEILEKARKSMKKLVDNIISLDLDEIDDYEFPQDEPFGLEIIYKEALFYLIIKFSSTNKNFICFSPGAFRRDRVSSKGEIIEPPHFSRWSWYKFFDETVITSADPTIFWDDEIKIGWMIGDNEHWYLETMSIIISKLAKNQKVINDNILFFGSSGGGFISVCLGTLIKNSKVLVNNSQFSLSNYWKPLVNQPIELMAHTFDGLSIDEIKEKIAYRMDAIKLFEKENYAPYITYYVNVNSKSDTTTHSIRLIEDHYAQNQFKGLNIVYYKEHKNSPHHPMQTKLTLDLIKSYAKNNLYNSKPQNKKTIINEEKYVKKLEKKFNNLKKENKNLKKENENLKNIKYEMENSKSWKITMPLRKLMNMLKRN